MGAVLKEMLADVQRIEILNPQATQGDIELFNEDLLRSCRLIATIDGVQPSEEARRRIYTLVSVDSQIQHALFPPLTRFPFAGLIHELIASRRKRLDIHSESKFDIYTVLDGRKKPTSGPILTAYKISGTNSAMAEAARPITGPESLTDTDIDPNIPRTDNYVPGQRQPRQTQTPMAVGNNSIRQQIDPSAQIASRLNETLQISAPQAVAEEKPSQQPEVIALSGGFDTQHTKIDADVPTISVTNPTTPIVSSDRKLLPVNHPTTIFSTANSDDRLYRPSRPIFQPEIPVNAPEQRTDLSEGVSRVRLKRVKETWDEFAKEHAEIADQNELANLSVGEVVALGNQLIYTVAERLGLRQDSTLRTLDNEKIVQLREQLADGGVVLKRHGKQEVVERERLSLDATAANITRLQPPHNLNDNAARESLAEAAGDGLVLAWIAANTDLPFTIETTPNARGYDVAQTIAIITQTPLQVNYNLQCMEFPKNPTPEQLQILNENKGTVPWQKGLIDAIAGEGTYDRRGTYIQAHVQELLGQPGIHLVINHTQEMQAMQHNPLLRTAELGTLTVTQGNRIFIESNGPFAEIPTPLQADTQNNDARVVTFAADLGYPMTDEEYQTTYDKLHHFSSLVGSKPTEATITGARTADLLWQAIERHPITFVVDGKDETPQNRYQLENILERHSQQGIEHLSLRSLSTLENVSTDLLQQFEELFGWQGKPTVSFTTSNKIVEDYELVRDENGKLTGIQRVNALPLKDHDKIEEHPKPSFKDVAGHVAEDIRDGMRERWGDTGLYQVLFNEFHR